MKTGNKPAPPKANQASKPSQAAKAPKAKAGDSAAGANKPVDALQYPFDASDSTAARRLHIPSREEAGQESQAIAGKPTSKAVALNPVTTRGQDPELYWMHKYAATDQQTALQVDIRSLYRHEHIAPEKIIARLYRFKGQQSRQNELFTNELFGNPLAMDELDKPGSYYRHADRWQNRLIQGDSLLCMTSLLEREGMAGQVQCVYMDPPYGIKYGSNWQMRLNDRNVKDGADDNLSGEPEVIKAFRDTWELGIHSYLGYLRDRLLVARELLSNSGSCFVQISDENVHLVRCLMDEVFGSENLVVTICFQKKSYQDSVSLAPVNDYIVWYAKDKSCLKFRKLFEKLEFDGDVGKYSKILSPTGLVQSSLQRTGSQINTLLNEGWKLMRDDYPLISQDPPKEPQPFVFNGITYLPPPNRHWSVKYPEGLQQLADIGRIRATDSRLYAIDYWDDKPIIPLSNFWPKLKGAADPVYVVQTTTEVVQRCILMTTDPGDLVLDPTCGSGTTAYVAEQWGRRWITSDTSRIALNIAKTRLMTATFPWYRLADTAAGDIRHGFVYKTVPHVTLKSLANNEPPETETLYDQPEQDKKKLRVAGPFTVETLQSFEPLAPAQMGAANVDGDSIERFTQRIYAHLISAGIKNGDRNETAVFNRVDSINDQDGALHAEGWYLAKDSAGNTLERKAYLFIGPQFGSVSKAAVNAAVKACRQRADADWLVILGFAFESDVDNRNVSLKVGSFEVTKARMHDDLMQDGLIKKDKKAASFVTIGEPDVGLVHIGDTVQVEIRGLDIYDPVKDEVKARSVADIAYWMLDDQYNGSDFVPTQVFFCGGDKDEFDKFRRGLHSLALASTQKAAERTLKIELDEEAFARIYGFVSHRVPRNKGDKLAVRVVSQFGEESTKVLTV